MTNDKFQAFAIIRLDLGGSPITSEDANIRISVKEIVPTIEAAKAEVDRLTAINEDVRTHYFWQATRYYSNGRSSSS